MSQLECNRTQITSAQLQLEILSQWVIEKCRTQVELPVPFTSFISGPFVEAYPFLYIHIPDDYNSSLLLNQADISVLVYTDSFMYQAKCRPLSLEGGKLKCHIPHELYKLNRREAYRYKLGLLQKVSAEFLLGHEKLTFPLSDISVDGLGVLLPTALSSRVSLNTFAPLELKFKDRAINLEVEFRSLLSTCNPEQLKLGIRINKFPPGAQSFISNFINSARVQTLKKVL